MKCIDPCSGVCGLNAACNVIKHSPICTCRSGHTGDPFVRCYILPRKFYFIPCDVNNIRYIYFTFTAPSIPVSLTISDPCLPSPCGPYSQCRRIGETPSCTCIINYTGVPPNCRPECIINSDCSSNLACIREKCIDPCLGSCGINTKCSVFNHIPICMCIEGYIGDPFNSCRLQPSISRSFETF